METPARQTPALSSNAETAVLHMQSAFRRRGLASREGDLPGAVIVEHGARRVVIRLIAGRWYRPVSGDPDTSVPVGREGAEDYIARAVAGELLERLP
jgi:hypothetical protein